MAIITNSEDFFNSEEGKKRLEESQKIKGIDDFDEECIDNTTYFIPSDTRPLMVALAGQITRIVDLAGHEMVYIGKTSNPYKRMTGKDMNLNESFGETGTLNEAKDHIPIHNVPHKKNKYKRMYILTEVHTFSEVGTLEKTLIEHFWDTNRNKSKGGEGPDGGMPYYIYVVIHEDSKMFNDTAS